VEIQLAWFPVFIKKIGRLQRSCLSSGSGLWFLFAFSLLPRFLGLMLATSTFAFTFLECLTNSHGIIPPDEMNMRRQPEGCAANFYVDPLTAF
jgi:hypothetical protein